MRTNAFLTLVSLLAACDQEPVAPAQDIGTHGRVAPEDETSDTFGTSEIESLIESPNGHWSQARHPLATEEAQRELARVATARGVSREDALQWITFGDYETVDEFGVRGGSFAVEAEREVVSSESPEESPMADPVLSAEALDRLDGLDADDWVYIDVKLDPMVTKGFGTAQMAVHRAAARGDISNLDDERLVRRRHYEMRSAAGDEMIERFIMDARALDVVVEGRVGWSGRVSLRVRAGVVRALATLPGVHRIDFGDSEITEDCDINTSGNDGFLIEGTELQGLAQSEQFYVAGYGGAGQRYALLEPNAHQVFRRHPGLMDGRGAQRFANCGGTGSTCVNNDPTAMTGTGAHSTAVASILIGDLTLGQFGNFPAGSTGARNRSGLAREATALGVPTGIPLLARAEGVVVDPNNNIDMVNMSASNYDQDTDCDGVGSYSDMADNIYEAGIPFFKSAGNHGHTSTSDCTVGAPGSAVGAFAVGVYSWFQDTAGSTCFSSSPSCTVMDIGNVSSRGGISGGDGRGRKIIALAAPEGFQYPYPHYDRPQLAGTTTPVFFRSDWHPSDGFVGADDNSDGVISRGEFGGMTATSAATPVVAGFAGVFREFYLTEKSTLINDPGVLYSNLLVMGDRRRENGTYGLVGTDNLWGAGALRGRMWNSVGYDAPAYWGTGSVCVPHQTWVVVNINVSGGVPQPLNAATDYVKVGTYFYDSDFGNSTSNVLDVLYYDIESSTNGTSWSVEEFALADHKQVLIDDSSVGGKRYRIRFFGVNVTEDNAGCGTDSARVYFTYIAEDNARNDGDLPACVREEQ